MQSRPSSPFPLTSQLGRVLRGRFRIDSLIGTGSMGAVFQAWDEECGQPCAVKLLLPSSSQREMISVRFLDEARLISQLCHPNIVEIWDQGEESDGTLYLAMELLKGQDLYSLLQAQGSLPLPQALDIAKQIGSALHMVHLAGIVHRDIKPQNIYLLPTSGQSLSHTVKVIDFGLAKLLDQERAPKRGSDGMLIGTPSYLPPEAWSGVSSDVDARADQWALAVLVYLMLSGHMPYESDRGAMSLAIHVHRGAATPLRELLSDIPSHINAAVMCALSKEKEQRFASVLDFVRALHKLPPAAPVFSPLRSPAGPAVFLSEYPVSAAAPASIQSAHAAPLLETLVAESLASSATTAQLPIIEPTQTIIKLPLSQPIPALVEQTDLIPRRRMPRGYLLPALSAAAAILSWSGFLFGNGFHWPTIATPASASLATPSFAMPRQPSVQQTPEHSAAPPKPPCKTVSASPSPEPSRRHTSSSNRQ